MAFDFRGQQRLARRNSRILVVMMILGTIAIALQVYIVISAIEYFIRASNYEPASENVEYGYVEVDGEFVPEKKTHEPAREEPDPGSILSYKPGIFWPTVGGVILLVAAASFLKCSELKKSGGAGVAAMLGGRLVPRGTKEPKLRRLVNIVEEMAIASGITPPPVYIVPGSGINAFAAGSSIEESVVAVTEGAVDKLSRDELQGVVAHEFSHILSEDVRLATSLTGVIAGIVLLALIGKMILYVVLYSGRSSRRSSRGGGLVLALLAGGAAIWLIGVVGELFGNMIKAAVSRQREYLADASAVQFSRNPKGIGGALQKINGSASGGGMDSSRSPQFNHLFFASSGTFMEFLFSSHPPIEKRIKSILGGRAKLTAEVKVQRFEDVDEEPAAAAPPPIPIVPAAAVAASAVADSIEHAAAPAPEHVEFARKIRESIPSALSEAVESTLGAQAAVCAILIDRFEEDVRVRQVELIRSHSEPLRDETLRLIMATNSIGSQERLVVVEQAAGSLRNMSDDQFRDFVALLDELIKADQRVTLFEWALRYTLIRKLRKARMEKGARRRPVSRLQPLQDQLAVLMSAMAWSGTEDAGEAAEAFARGASMVSMEWMQLIGSEGMNYSDLDKSLEAISRLAPQLRHDLLRACAEIVTADGMTTEKEAVLLRVLAGTLGLPMPPVLV